jgi:carboxypeptidase Taq
MPGPQDAYGDLKKELQELAVLRSCTSVLGWDEQTYLPHQGAEHRAKQLALLSGMAHERATSSRLGDLLKASAELTTSAPESAEAANVRESQRKYDRAAKLPRRLVEELSHCSTLSQQAWVAAKRAKDFNAFRPWLEKMTTLKREEAQAVGGATPYDALLDEYEPGAVSAEIAEVFRNLRNELVPLVQAIRNSSTKTDTSVLTRKYPIPAQREFSLLAARAIGFDLNAGRLDEAAHPFCSGIGPGDCRLTTRYNDQHFPGAFFGTLHEAGHGIYEQGLRAEEFGLPTGEACSLGIHESQSRMWENLIGRGRPFWMHFYPMAQRVFPDALGNESQEHFYQAINDVRPSWIRVEADEVTYNLHIMLRFDLERPLIAGDLQPKDVPGVWNETFQQYFGMTPPDDSLGCLQDVHWSAGLIGYFPTYALGNMYAAQFFEQARKEIPDLDTQFSRGEFRTLKDWLVRNIHQRGGQYRANRLVEIVTGRPLSAEPLLRHLKSRFGAIYGV